MRATTVAPILAAVLATAPLAKAADHLQTTPAPVSPDAIIADGLPDLSSPLPFAEGCGATVGLVGSYFGAQITDTLTSYGLTVLNLDAAAIAGGALDSVSAIYITRAGVGIASSEAAAIDAWLNAGGVAMSEFTATSLWYDGGAFDYLDGALVDGFYVPSGTVCGNNTIVVNDPSHPVAEGLPAAWDCSGDPIGVLNVYEGIDPNLCVIASAFGVDRDGDGVDDPVVAAFDVGDGAVIIFYTDFGDWQALEDPRVNCTSCMRTPEDETLLLNALCQGAGCSAVLSCAECEAVHATIDAMEIDVEGVRNSLHSQFAAACRALERGQLHTSGNILCAMLDHNEAQDALDNENKHVSHESAVALEECVRSFAEANEIPLRVPDNHCGTVLED